jgi:Zn-dependent protease with chaperone function/Zn-finger nucleic acid-binding protein
VAGEPVSVQRRALFEVEREKRWRIWLLFSLLLALAFITVWVACLIVLGVAHLAVPLVGPPAWLFSAAGVAAVLGAALVLSLIYWGLAQIGARARLLRAMHCRPLDAGDRYHQRLANIVEEMRIATGAPRIECVTVRTVGFNAFAFSDLHGGSVVGVTEGALARLSRQQLQAVVAHEFAHILSGSYITVTVSCLLFGIYSSLADTLEGAAGAGSDDDEAAAALAVLPLRGALWLMQCAASVVGAAISRERERQADLAAARYMRDPLALAEALRIVGRHPGGAGFIPEGLGPLCIRATGSPGWPAVSWRDPHPPLEERIHALLAVANVSPQDFERQAAQAREDHAGREHWAPAPAGRQVGALAAAPGSAPPVGAASAAGLLAAAGPAAAVRAAAPGSRPSGVACPSCGAALATAPYEGIDVLLCERCGGRLVSTPQVGKLLARREAAFTDEQERLAGLLSSGGDRLRRAAVLARGRSGVTLIACPRCSAQMMRRHYSYEHAVEVDRCVRCDLIWFEKDELEALQILVERQTG